MELTWKFLEDGSLYVEDPIYKKPYVLPPHIAGMFRTKEMQRLQKIKQTDYSWLDWPGLENNRRWRHSMGVAHLGHELFEKFQKEVFLQYGIEMDQMEREIAECVLSAHDIGHLDNSHHSEKLIQYSHEARTVDILLGDTEVGEYLRSKYPQDKIEQVVSIISKINNDEEIDNTQLSPLMQLYSQVVSSSYDIDKVDYTLGDSYYAGIPSGVDPYEIINGFSATVDKNGDLRLAIKEKAQRQGERLQIERFQNYRDIYYCVSSELMDVIAPYAFELILQEPEEIKQKLPVVFRKKIEAGMANKRITTLEEELQMTDDVTEAAYEMLSKEAKNPVLRYLCDTRTVRRDCVAFVNGKNREVFLQELQSIFPDRDLSGIKALHTSKSACKLKKPNEDFLIEKENGEIVSIERQEGTVIKPQVFELRRVYFNSELLRLELGLSEREFEQYKPRIESFIDNMLGRTEEFQARYTLEDKSFRKEDLIEILKMYGFSFLGTDTSINIDRYYDTRNFDMLMSGRELRGREIISTDTTKEPDKMSAMYKCPADSKNSNYTFRKIFEESSNVGDITLERIKQALAPQVPELADIPLEAKPIIVANTKRTKLYFIRNGKAICVAWDETQYDNKWFDQRANDIMIEVQNRRGTSKLVLKAIDQIFSRYSDKFKKCQISKVLRGARLTHRQEREMVEERTNDNLEQRKSDTNGIEREKKIRFSEKDRENLALLLPEIMKQLGYQTKTGNYELEDQTDYYFDTPSFYYAKSEGEPSLRTREKKDGKLKSTYKVPEVFSNSISERKEIESIPQTTTAEDFIKAMKEKGVVIYPDNLELITKVVNHRRTQVFYRDGIEFELAIDDVMNVDPKKQKSKKSSKGEFEIEIKSADCEVEKQRQILESIWNSILEACKTQGIELTPSEHNKYVSSLIELELIKEHSQEQEER